MPTLVVPERRSLGAWNRWLVDRLLESGTFRQRHGELPRTPESRRWRRNFHVMRVEESLVGVDTWDLEGPTTTGHSVLNELDLLLKIQYRPHDLWRALEIEHGLRITSWTMFAYDGFPMREYAWSPDSGQCPYSYSGHAKRPKRRWLRHMRRSGVEVHDMLEPNEYVPLLRNSRWGVILKGRTGRHCDGKNRREPALASWGMPLALNYTPHYPVSMLPDVDFVHLREPTDLDRLKDIDPRPYAEASIGLWHRLFSPRAMAGNLLDLVRAL